MAISFDRLNIYFYGIDSSAIRSLSPFLKENGTIISSILGKQTTHLITGEDKLKDGGYQIAQAIKLRIPIVLLSWLEHSIEGKRVLPLDLYILVEPEEFSESTTGLRSSGSTSSLRSSNNIPSSLRSSNSSSLSSSPFKSKLTSSNSTGNDNSDNNNSILSTSSSLRKTQELSQSSLNNLLKNAQLLTPNVKSVIPSSGVQSNLKVVITGNNFNVSGDGVCVKIGPLQITGVDHIQVHSRTCLVVTIPDRPLLPLGLTVIKVSNDNGGIYSTGSDFFIVQVVITEVDDERRLSYEINDIVINMIEKKGQSVDSQNSDNVMHDSEKREIRIFLSSPFRDMQAERDWFVKCVAPKLKKMCTERGVSLSYVDLRWGVTGDQSSQAISLLMCLRELKRSNIFIGLYGARYGWSYSSNPVLDTDNDLILKTFEMASKEFPWVDKYKDRSITEVEMRVILDSIQSMPGIFFLRDNEKFLETVKIGNRYIYQSEGQEQESKLNKLVNDIQASKYQCTNYTQPFDMAEQAFSQLGTIYNLTLLEKIINDKFPLETIPDKYSGEGASHFSFLTTLSRIYSHPFIVTGKPGVGKSSLLANWVTRFKKHHPEDIVFFHFVGCSTASTIQNSMILRIMEEIKQNLGEASKGLHIPSGPQIVQDFSLWLAKAVEKMNSQRFIIVIDGLEKLEDYDNSLDLLWLPREFPQRVKIILSMCSNTRPENAMKKRKHDSLEIIPLLEWDRVEFIRTYLDWHSKKLDEEQEFLIASAKQVENPRFGKILLDDIAVFGDYEKLNERIRLNLEASTTQDLYVIVIRRLHEDFDKDNSGVVEAFFTLIWASRRGLTEEEISIMMNGMGYSRSEWSPILLAMEDMLFRSGDSELLNFSDLEFNEAVRREYIVNEKKTIFAHETIANYFANLKVTLRKAEEYPWQISQIKSSKRLSEALSDLDIILELWFHPELKFSLIKWWRELEKEGFSMVQVYNSVLDFYEKDKYYQEGKEGIKITPFLAIGNILEESRKLEAAENIFNRAYKLANDSNSRMDCMSNLARLYETQARFDAAEEMLRESLKECNLKYGSDSIQSSNVMTRLGSVLIHTSKLVEANEMLKKSLQIRQKILGKSHSRCGQTLKHLLVVAQNQGDYVTAENYAIEALKNTEESCGPFDFHVSSILLRMGELYNLLHRHKEAESCFERALNIRVTKYGDDHTFTGDVLREIAVAHENQQQWTEAEENYTKALRIKLVALGDSHPDIAQLKNRLAAIYIHQKRYDEAEVYLIDALRIREEKLGANHSRVGQTLKHMLSLYELIGNYQKAANCGYRALENTKHSFGEDHFHVSSIYLRLGILESSLNQYEKAENSFEIAKKIRINKFGEDHDYVADVLHELGKLSLKQKDNYNAKRLLEEAYQIRFKAKGPTHLLTTQTSELLKQIVI